LVERALLEDGTSAAVKEVLATAGVLEMG